MILFRDRNLTVRDMEPGDIPALCEGFQGQGWMEKNESLFSRYLKEREQGKRRVILGEWQGKAAGYVTLLPKAEEGPFLGKPWPMICDFNVLEAYQRRGIGNRLLDEAEQLAAETSAKVCLGVGLYSGYGAAQRIYVKRGYIPDGSGVWYDNVLCVPGEAHPVDDELVLYLAKDVEHREIRALSPKEIEPGLFSCFDRFQVVEKCWRKEDGRWQIKDVPFTERWSDKDYEDVARCLKKTVQAGGEVWGVFLNGKLKGYVSVEGSLMGSRKQYADLSSLYVSADRRKMGLGRRLFLKAEERGKRMGAEKLYLSAHSSVESQAFYRKMGCVEAEEYDAAHVAAEPCDCQLEYLLNE